MSLEKYYTGAIVNTAAIAPCDLVISQIEKGLQLYKSKVSSGMPEKMKIDLADECIGFPILLMLVKSTNTSPEELVKRFEEIKRADDLIHPKKS